MKLATLLAGATLALAASQAHAFCVYNKIDKPFYAVVRNGGNFVDPQTYRPFDKTIQPGKDACCNWKNKDCNKSGKRTEMLTFGAAQADYKGKGMMCRSYGKWTAKKVLDQSNLEEATMQAGGYATMERNPSFKPKEPILQDNAPYVLKSWSYDDKPTGEKPCF